MNQLDLLRTRKQKGICRQLPSSETPSFDFSSNDYLGVRGNQQLQLQILSWLQQNQGESLLGAGGSRLISGQNPLVARVEQLLCQFFKAEAGLLYSSGYAANIGLLQAIAGEDDVVLFDQHVHASFYNGMKLSPAQCFFFRHNDVTNLKDKLQRLRQKHRGSLFIGVEAIYSMDGSEAPLLEIQQLSQEFDATLIVDEAHSAGVRGLYGRGLCDERGVPAAIRVFTFGKAFGLSGAFIACSQQVVDLLLNFSHSFIYSTGVNGLSLLALEQIIRFFAAGQVSVAPLKENIAFLCDRLGVPFRFSPIFGFFGESIQQIRSVALDCRYHGFHVVPIYSPTVRKGEERIRLSLHSFNHKNQIDDLAQLMSGLWVRARDFL